jgi:hypothetical protein
VPHVILHQTIPLVVNIPTNTAGLSSYYTVTPTSDDSAGSTVTADSVNNTGATGTNAGSIAGGVIGALLGLAVVGFLVAFVLVSFYLFIHFRVI